MAGDWIKMRSSLCTHPKVGMIAEIIGKSEEIGRRLFKTVSATLDSYVTRDVTRDVTLAALLRVWSAANEHTDDGVMKNCSLETVDQAAGLPGFGAAMQAAGWLIFDAETRTVVFPDFLENNAPAKNHARSTAAERQARYREKRRQKDDEPRESNGESNGNSNVTRDVTVTSQSNAREEKRREDSKQPPIPPDGGGTESIDNQDDLGQRRRKKREGEPLKAFLERCRTEGVKPIPAGDPIFEYMETIGLTEDMLVLCWFVFKNRYGDGKKLQKDWRAHFRNAVKSNWFKLWFIGNDGAAGLTTAGQQAQREMDAAHNKPRAA